MRYLPLQDGLTFLEMIVVVTVFLVVVALVVPRFFSSFVTGANTTDDDADSVANLIALAHTNAASNRDNAHWGIKIVDNGTTDCGSATAADCAVMYKGSNFSGRDSTYDQVHVLSGNNRWGAISDADFYFIKRTGFASDLYGMPTRGLVGYWPFTASTTLDMSGKNNSGTVSELTSHVTSTCAMNSGCFQFDGTNDQVIIPYHSSLNITADISILGWIKRSDTSAVADDAGFSTILAKAASATSFDYELYLSNESGSLNELRFYGDGPSWLDSDVTITDTTNWHHVAFTRSGSNWQFYLDGDPAANGSNGTAFGGNSFSVRIGFDTYHANTYHNGYLDDVMLYNRGLSENEILQIYNTTKPTSTTPGARVMSNIHVLNGVATSTVRVYGDGAVEVIAL